MGRNAQSDVILITHCTTLRRGYKAVPCEEHSGGGTTSRSLGTEDASLECPVKVDMARVQVLGHLLFRVPHPTLVVQRVTVHTSSSPNTERAYPEGAQNHTNPAGNVPAA